MALAYAEDEDDSEVGSLAAWFYAERRIWEGHWLWDADNGYSDYGWTPFGSAHRLSWELFKGPIPETDEKGNKIFVCHHCDIPRCVNPSHLFLGTAKDNTQDMLKKGRGVGGPNQPHPNAGAHRLTIVAYRALYEALKTPGQGREG